MKLSELNTCYYGMLYFMFYLLYKILFCFIEM